MEFNKHNFVGLIQSNQGIIKSLCKAYYPGAEDQKDVFQDIVFQLWKSFETFRGESQIGTWIYKVSLNTILSKVRKEEKQISTESIDSSGLVFSSAGADDDVELLNRVIHSLKGLDKAIVILFLEGYKNREIAEMLNITATNVSTRLNRVKTDLKTRFKDKSHEFKQP